MTIRCLAFGSGGAGILSLVWFVFFLAQELFALPVHIPHDAAKWVGVPLTLVLPGMAIALGLAAVVKLRGQSAMPIPPEQVAATSGVILGGVVLLLCLLTFLWILSLPT